MSSVKSPKSLLPGIAASAVLSVVTLGVFYKLSSTGPVATLKLFHVAVQDRDSKLLERVTDAETDPNASYLVYIVRGYMDRGAQFRLVDSKPERNSVLMTVTYSVGSQTAPMFFVLNREGRTWRIDATASLQTLNRALGRV